MAHPKRKISRTRRDKRRTHYKIDTPQVGTCTNCGAPAAPHHVCGSCGYYRGQVVVLKQG